MRNVHSLRLLPHLLLQASLLNVAVSSDMTLLLFTFGITEPETRDVRYVLFPSTIIFFVFQVLKFVFNIQL